MSDEKRPHGQPTKYRQEYCQMLIEHMEKGYSYESFSAIVSVHKGTLYDWEPVHEEWAEAKTIAFGKCQLFWEKAGIEGLYSTTEYSETTGKPTHSKSMNATTWIFNMKNRFHWRDKQPDENDATIKLDDITKRTDEEIDVRLRQLAPKFGFALAAPEPDPEPTEGNEE